MTDSDVTFDLGADYDLISDVHDNPRDWISLRRRTTAMFTHQALHKYTARCADLETVGVVTILVCHLVLAIPWTRAQQC